MRSIANSVGEETARRRTFEMCWGENMVVPGPGFPSLMWDPGVSPERDDHGILLWVCTMDVLMLPCVYSALSLVCVLLYLVRIATSSQRRSVCTRATLKCCDIVLQGYFLANHLCSASILGDSNRITWAILSLFLCRLLYKNKIPMNDFIYSPAQLQAVVYKVSPVLHGTLCTRNSAVSNGQIQRCMAPKTDLNSLGNAVRKTYTTNNETSVTYKERNKVLVERAM
jgi:hypothetical protein